MRLGGRKLVYGAKIEQDEQGYWLVTFPCVPRCATDGKTKVEAIDNAHDALKEALCACAANGEPIPDPAAIVHDVDALIVVDLDDLEI